MLRLGGVFQLKVGDQLLAEMAARPFGKQGVATEQRHAGHVIRFRIASPIQPEIAGDHTLDPSRFHDEFACGKTRVYFDSQLLGLLTEPATEVAEADDAAALVVHAWRHRPVGQLQGAAVALQQVHLIVVDLDPERGLLPALWQQLLEGDGIQQSSGEQMGADLSPFSSRQTDSSALCCLRAMAALSPAGPPPTMTTSNSIASRSILPLCSTWPRVVLVVYVNVK